jgi:hypothetical protein
MAYFVPRLDRDLPFRPGDANLSIASQGSLPWGFRRLLGVGRWGGFGNNEIRLAGTSPGNCRIDAVACTGFKKSAETTETTSDAK